MFSPDFGSALVQWSVGPVPVKALICKACGLITLAGDIDYLREQLAKK